MNPKSELMELADEMRQWRRHLHAHPETAFEERDTADFIARLLTDWGLKIHRGLAVTGVVGTLRSGTSNRAIGLRADMDALNLTERNSFDHRSRTPGKMHACGHDGHMAMLLGAARHLSSTRQFNGTIHFIFQPAEENEAGGRRMIEDGLFDLFPVEAVYGMHNMPFIPEGKIAVRAGPVMASADLFKVIVTGKGAHGAWPHNGIDAINIASQIVLGFNHITARTVDPLESAVISVTQFNAGHTSNVLPETATLIGTTRAFSVAMQDHLEARMRQLCEGIAAAHGAKIELIYERRYPPTVNSPQETEFAAQAAARVVGKQNVLRDEPPVMGAEDFAWMLLKKAGAYVWIGNGPEHQGGCMLHNPSYDFNDRILPIGASYWVELAETQLPRQGP
jgi:hippurate hydrolase